MKKQKIKIIVTVLAAFFNFFVINLGNAEPQSDKYHSYLRTGIEKAFNMEIVNVNSHLQKAVELDPGNQTGYTFLAILNLFACEMTYDESTAKSH
jgi:hypothetical protein